MATILSNLTLESGDAEPKYRRVKSYLLAQIADGRLRPGQALPTEVQLAEQLAISRTTIRQAFAELERGGVIRRIRGRGTFISETAAAHARHPASGDTVRQASSLFGLVLPEVHHGFYPALQQSFASAAGELHRQVIVCNSDQDTLRQADLLLQLADRRVMGVGIVPTSRPDALTPPHHVRPLQGLGIPVVFCHRPVEGVRAPLVAFSGLEVGRAAGRALAERGHRRVAYFGTHRSQMSELYLRGLRERFVDAGVEPPDECVFFGSRVGHAVTAEHEHAVRHALEGLLAAEAPPTAIFASFDSEAELIYLLLGQLGVKVPDDVSLIGVGGASRVGPLAQRLTSVTVDEGELGRRVVALLDEMQRGDRPLDDAEVSMVPVSLSEGRTLRAVD